MTTAGSERLDDFRSRQRAIALERGINPRDIDLLLSHHLGRSVSWIVAHGDEAIDAEEATALLSRRWAGEPIQYIRGRTEFFRHELAVDDRVLIPRPETELVVETALRLAPRNGRVIDVGTGSGCIGLSIALERSDLTVFATDRSVEALHVAAMNRRLLRAPVRLAASDLFESVRGTFDLVVSNPPYVPEAEYHELEVEVRIYEPRLALTPGPHGLEIIERILDEAPALLAPRGRIILEVGYGQQAAVRDAAGQRRYAVDEILPDLAGIPRVVVLSRDAE